MNLIVAVDKKWSIGCDGKLLFNIPEDMKFFKKMTTGQVVVMGHSTLKSLPKGQPLKDRINIILSKDRALLIEGAIVCNSIIELLDEIKKYPANQVWVIGGEAVYNQLLDYCTHAYITNVDAIVSADKVFPNLEQLPQWQLSDSSEPCEYKGLTYRFTHYINNNMKEK